MKNKELLNICYKLFNRFITVDKLIEMLDNMDKKELPNEEVKELNNLIDDVKKIAISIPNTEDEYVIEEKKRLKESIDRFEAMTNKSPSINNILKHLKKDYEKKIDSHERWSQVFNYIIKNDYFKTCFSNLSDYELLEFIIQNIQAPLPPNLSQEEFENLVNIAIEKDKREWLWRLAFNYIKNDINFDSIVDYFISKKDGYYLSELISAVGCSLDIDAILDKLNDKELIKYLIDSKNILKHYMTDKQFDKLDKLYEKINKKEEIENDG